MRTFVATIWLFLCFSAQGFEILIDQGNDQVSSLAVVPFNAPAGVQDMTPIVEFDLARSGQFAPMDATHMLSLPNTPDEINYRDWKVLGVQYVVIGDVSESEDGTLSVTYHVFNVTLEQRLHGGTVSGPTTAFRDIAHLVADKVFEAIADIPGAFSTKIMYVLVQGRATENPLFSLQIADSDGANVQTILESPHPILSPSWSPDGQKICYVSFETGRSTVIVHELATGERDTIAAFEGTNSAPTFSPDGTHIALSLSKDGNFEIYTVRLRDLNFRRITNHRGIDTEPSWTADGNSLIFTSDRAGNPQLYSVKLNNLNPKRLTFEGDYNARPRMHPDGEHLLYVHRADDAGFHIVWQSLNGDTQPRILTSNVLDESPSLSPNGEMVVYATRDQNRGILAVVSTDGQVALKLPSEDGDVQEPAWSPFMASSLVSRDI
ncbi:MAG: Tol-Pal system beta propeller repeat protein TolB [Gammaproteobacteria bacterium]|nr:Tol-Pal system beta propeller repeat protein TolB [Gammaproteobacteria bacterium]